MECKPLLKFSQSAVWICSRSNLWLLPHGSPTVLGACAYTCARVHKHLCARGRARERAPA
eukprot:10516240-Alexandrium_andersonii.AAC.1